MRVKVLSATGVELFDGTTSMRSIKAFLHDHFCSPRAAVVDVIAHKDGSLTPSPTGR